MLKIVESTNRRAVEALLSPKRPRDAATDRRVATIVSDVRRKGDRALLKYAKSLDGLTGPIEISRPEMQTAAATVPKSVRAAIRAAARNIRAVATRQVPRSWRVGVTAGVSVEQRVIPLDRVGCYVPGGRYPLPSSLLMTAIPAVAAGVRDVVAVCPRPEPVVMAAAIEAGVSRLFRLGGAHAIAALAYGTESVPRVDKIVGPGNRWVASAKALVASDCGIDFYAGPSEILLLSSNGDPAWIAADLIAQAEHDPDARAVLITPNRKLAAQRRYGSRGSNACRWPGSPVDEATWRRHRDARRWPKRSRSPTPPRPSTWSSTMKRRRRRSNAWARCSSAVGRRRSPVTTRSARITCCRQLVRRVSAEDCPPRISCGRSPCSVSHAPGCRVSVAA